MAKFKIDPRLANLLGDSYRSTEYALKELVDNAWDADASEVYINLPKSLSELPQITIKDNGTGMSLEELRDEYLFVASGRFSRKGETTSLYKRRVKGRKGIGKFAGLMIANTMQVETWKNWVWTSLIIPTEKFLKADVDFSQYDFPIETSRHNSSDHGTMITLSDLALNLVFPNAESLRQLLVLEYHHQPDFKIYVNQELLEIKDIPGENFIMEARLEKAGYVRMLFAISNEGKALKNSGIAISVGGKIIGKPSYFDLDDDENIPRKLLKRVYGEIQADYIDEKNITADWGIFIENSQAYLELHSWAANILLESIKKVFAREVTLANARLKAETLRKLESLPEHKKESAKRALGKIMHKFFGETPERIDAIASVVIDAFERDEYWIVIDKIHEARHSEVSTFAEALEEFGLMDIAFMVRQAMSRLNFLDELEQLILKKETVEASMHKALENNLWVFGVEFSLMSSNRTLVRTIDDYLGKKYSGNRASKRPDLFLSRNLDNMYLLIEFKRPSLPIGRDQENQAIKYRDDLSKYFSGAIDIFVIGNSVDSNISSQYQQGDVRLLSYSEVIGRARNQLEWLIKELSSGK